jgi:hypothetical protein
MPHSNDACNQRKACLKGTLRKLAKGIAQQLHFAKHCLQAL